MRAISLPLTLLLLAIGWAGLGCEETPSSPPSAENLPNIVRDPGPRFPEASLSGSSPVRTKIVQGPEDTISIGDYRGSGGGGSRSRPPGYPRGRHQEPDEMHAAARDVAGRQIRSGSEACQLAYEAMRDLQRARQSKTAGRQRAASERDNFVDSCELRPEIEQWCMVPSYIRQNSAECDRRAHTRYAQAIERYDSRAGGQSADWAPTEDPAAIAPTEAPAQEVAPTEAPAQARSPTMGPVRLDRD